VMRWADGLLNIDQQLSATAVRRFELTQKEESEVNAAFARSFVKARENMLKNTETIPDNSLGKFRIRASPETALAMVNALSADLTKTVGEERGRSLLNSINLWSYYGAFGLLDGEVKFVETKFGGTTPEEPSTTTMHYMVEFRDPNSGAVRQSATGLYATMAKHYGKDTFQAQDR